MSEAKSDYEYSQGIRKNKKRLEKLDRIVNKDGVKGFFQRLLPGGKSGKEFNPEWLDTDSEIKRLQHIREFRRNLPKKQSWEEDPEVWTKDVWKKEMDKKDKRYVERDEKDKQKFNIITRNKNPNEKEKKWLESYKKRVSGRVGTRYEDVE